MAAGTCSFPSLTPFEYTSCMHACRQFRPSPETSLHDLNLTVGSSQLYVLYNFTSFLYQNRYQLKRYCNTSRLPKYIERPPRQQWVFISMAFEKGNIVIVHIFTCTFLLNVILAGCCTPSVIYRLARRISVRRPCCYVTTDSQRLEFLALAPS